MVFTKEFLKATPVEVNRARESLEIYLHVFDQSMADFATWLHTSETTLNDHIDRATIVELKKLEDACFAFCKERLAAS